MYGKRKSSAARSACYVDDRGIALAHLERAGSGRSLLGACSIPFADIVDIVDIGGIGSADWRKPAEARLDGVDLRRAPLSTVIKAGTYLTLLVEKPNVAADEVEAALRWRIKDLIDYDIDEAVIQILEMPEQSNPGHKPTVYAVVAPRATIDQQMAAVSGTGLALDVIDIPELCIRNVARVLAQDEDGVAFLHFVDSGGLLTVTRGGVLYLIRRIELGALDAAGAHDLASEDVVNQISLELQRSLDYYESHFDLKPISDLVLGPNEGIAALSIALNAALGLRVATFDLADHFDMRNEMSMAEQSECLLAVGATLRAERKAA